MKKNISLRRGASQNTRSDSVDEYDNYENDINEYDNDAEDKYLYL